MLVYHGLGTGKTGASIGIIESCIDTRNVTVILPASLRDNYRRELEKFVPSFFGNGYLGGSRYWKFRSITTTEDFTKTSSELQIPKAILEKNNGVYELHETKVDGGMTRQEFSTDERKKLDEQIVKTIFHKITFVASNGLDEKKAKELDFDNNVIVCDEVQKIISMRRNRSRVGMLLYTRIRDAKNAKVIALSGTPAVNAPYEIAILANMLHGHHTLHVFTMKFTESRTSADQTDEAVTRNVLSDPVVKYTRVQPSKKRGGGNELVVVRHPTGFRSVYDSEGRYAGVVYEPTWKGGSGNETVWRQKLANRLRESGILILETPSSVRTEKEEWLPEDEDMFLEMYTTDIARNIEGDEIIKRKEDSIAVSS